MEGSRSAVNEVGACPAAEPAEEEPGLWVRPPGSQPASSGDMLVPLCSSVSSSVKGREYWSLSPRVILRINKVNPRAPSGYSRRPITLAVAFGFRQQHFLQCVTHEWIRQRSCLQEAHSPVAETMQVRALGWSGRPHQKPLGGGGVGAGWGVVKTQALLRFGCDVNVGPTPSISDPISPG